jgi:KDO2-lipid IV(A) lauroyltransferase
VAFPLALKTLSNLSLASLYRIADFCSLLVTAIPNRTAKLIRQNIHLCFADQDEKQLCRSTIKHTCYSALELAAVWCWPAEKILARITSENICDSFNQSEKGRIVIAPHLGSWELLNLWLAGQGDLVSLYKPQPNAGVDQFVLNARSRNGAQLIPIDASGLRQLSKGLKQGKTAMILPDQRPKKGKARVMANFFGHGAPTTPLIHNLCRRIDCDIFLACIFRNRAHASFELTLVELDHDKIAADQQSGLDYLNGEIETLIRQQPEQYQWGYSRFKPSTYRALVSGEH